ncbi:Nucleoid occlusion protein [subsurface metagenome]
MNRLKHISLDELKTPKFDSRLIPNPEKDDELRDSIKEVGVLEPILVKDTSDGYEIVAGNRRFREAGRAGLAAIPCVVIKVSGAEAEKIKLHENLKRLSLSHLDQAFTFGHMIKEFKMTEHQVSVLVGKSIAYVSQHLALLSCDENLQTAVHDGGISFSVARELMQCKDPDDRLRFQNLTLDNGASSRTIQSWVRESNRETDIATGKEPKTFKQNLPQSPQIPMYPCKVCGNLTEIPNLNVIRLCNSCNSNIFAEVERANLYANQSIPQSEL